jgi:hypothetical protein
LDHERLAHINTSISNYTDIVDEKLISLTVPDIAGTRIRKTAALKSRATLNLDYSSAATHTEKIAEP